MSTKARVSAGKAAAHIDVDRRTFSDLLDEGVITRQERSNYDLDVVRVEYIRHIRSIASGHGGTGKGRLDLAGERAALAKEQRETAALKNQMTRGDLVSIASVAKVVGRDYGIIREKILTLPGKVADRCAGRTREEIEPDILDEVTEILNDLHNPATYDYGRSSAEESAASPDQNSETAAAVDGGGMGGPVSPRVGQELGEPGKMEDEGAAGGVRPDGGGVGS